MDADATHRTQKAPALENHAGAKMLLKVGDGRRSIKDLGSVAKSSRWLRGSRDGESTVRTIGPFFFPSAPMCVRLIIVGFSKNGES